MSETPTMEPAVAGSRGRVGWLLRVPHHDRLAADLKREIPNDEREFLPDRHGWWVAKRYRLRAIRITLRYTASVMVLGEAGQPDQLFDRAGTRAEQGRLL